MVQKSCSKLRFNLQVPYVKTCALSSKPHHLNSQTNGQKSDVNKQTNNKAVLQFSYL